MSKQIHNGHIYRDKKDQQWLVCNPYIKTYKDKTEAARLFLSMVTGFNNIRLSKSELDFLAYMMMKDGGVVTVGKKGYQEQYDVSEGVVNNMVSLLKKKKVLVKIDNKVRIHPKIMVGFKDNDNFIFQFKCQKSL